MTITVPCSMWHDYALTPIYGCTRSNFHSTRTVEIPLATVDRWERVLQEYDSVQTEMATWERRQNGPGHGR